MKMFISWHVAPAMHVTVLVSKPASLTPTHIQCDCDSSNCQYVMHNQLLRGFLVDTAWRVVTLHVFELDLTGDYAVAGVIMGRTVL